MEKSTEAGLHVVKRLEDYISTERRVNKIRPADFFVEKEDPLDKVHKEIIKTNEILTELKEQEKRSDGGVSGSMNKLMRGPHKGLFDSFKNPFGFISKLLTGVGIMKLFGGLLGVGGLLLKFGLPIMGILMAPAILKKIFEALGKTEIGKAISDMIPDVIKKSVGAVFSGLDLLPDKLVDFLDKHGIKIPGLSKNPNKVASDSDVLEFRKGISFDGTDEHLQKGITELARVYKELTGQKLQITSAFRTIEQQEKLHKKYLIEKEAHDAWIKGGKHGPEPSVTEAAESGSSFHNYGLAVDIARQQADYIKNNPEHFRKILGEHSLVTPVSSENWHYENPIPGGFNSRSDYIKHLAFLKTIPLPDSNAPKPVTASQKAEEALRQRNEDAALGSKFLRNFFNLDIYGNILKPYVIPFVKDASVMMYKMHTGTPLDWLDDAGMGRGSYEDKNGVVHKTNRERDAANREIARENALNTHEKKYGFPSLGVMNNPLLLFNSYRNHRLNKAMEDPNFQTPDLTNDENLSIENRLMLKFPILRVLRNSITGVDEPSTPVSTLKDQSLNVTIENTDELAMKIHDKMKNLNTTFDQPNVYVNPSAIG